MSVRIRLIRGGRKNRPFYRIGVFDARTRRDGAAIENIGHYDPLDKSEGKPFVLDTERAKYWLSVGARPSETVASFLTASGIQWDDPTARRARNRKRAGKAKAKGGRPSRKAKKAAATAK